MENLPDEWEFWSAGELCESGEYEPPTAQMLTERKAHPDWVEYRSRHRVHGLVGVNAPCLVDRPGTRWFDEHQRIVAKFGGAQAAAERSISLLAKYGMQYAEVVT